MRQQLKLIVLGIFVLGVTSCKGMDGVLSVQVPLTIKAKKSSPWCDPNNAWENCHEEKTIVLNPGSYNAQFQFTSNDSAELTVQVSGQKEKAEMDIPKNLTLPEQGDFHLSSSQIGQDWDLNGHVRTVVGRTEKYREYESCWYEESDWVCRGYGRRGEDCHWVPVRRWGHRPVEYFIQTTEKYLDMAMLPSGSTQQLSQFSGQKSWSEKMYTYIGICR